MNIVTLLHDIVRQLGTKTAIIEDGMSICYQDLWDRIEKLSASFHAIGIRETHRIALILPTSSKFIYYFFALLKIESIVTPLSTDCTPSEMKVIFDNLNPHAIIAMPIIIERVCREYPGLLDNKIIVNPNDIAESGRLQTGLEQGDAYSIDNEKAKGNQIATIIYTYRGLGYPLGAILTHDNYLQAALFYLDRTELTEHHRVLLMLPSYHVFPLMGGIIAPLLAGAVVVIAKSFIISHLFETIKRNQITMLLAVPTLYRLIINYSRNDSDMKSVGCCITGGDVMLADMQKELGTKFNTQVLQGYGLTECLPVTCNPLHRNKVGSLGPPGRSDVKIKIVNDSGGELGQGSVGEIVINSPTVMYGYYRLDEITRDVLKEGWLYTGDYGYLDPDGYLYFTGRKKKVAKVGGKIVDLKEVKDVLLSHPAIEEVSLFSKGDQLWGHIIEAEINTNAKKKLNEAEIRAFCTKRLSQYKIPKVIRCPEKAEVSYT